MKRFRRLITGVLVFATALSACACSTPSKGGRTYVDGTKPEHRNSSQSEPSDPDVTAVPTSGSDDQITDFSMFITVSGAKKEYGNEIKELIAEKTGVRVEETWLPALTAEEAIDILIASDEFPDYVYAGDEIEALYENGSLIPWDEYLEIYPNLKNYYSEAQWDKFRKDDGHIYWANVFENFNQKDTSTEHNYLAFWIQARVLEWAGYPEVETLDQYFDLLERYAEANPVLPDGTEVIPYTCICESWRYYSLESAPQFLAGFPNDGSVIVDTSNGPLEPQVMDYNTSDAAKMYFKKLNEEYGKGILDPEFAIQTYDEYVSKLCTGRVLGLCDQQWDFIYSVRDSFGQLRRAEDGSTFKLSDIGCDYVPLGLVVEEGMDQQWHSYGAEINVSGGIAVTEGCSDPDLAFRFLNDLLSQEIHDLRFWGVEGVDYYVDDDLTYYRTEEMRAKWKDPEYKTDHICEYAYMPQWRGMSSDGINCMKPDDQPGEYKAGLPEPVRNCLDAYGAGNFVDMIGSVEKKSFPWFPMWSWSNTLGMDTPYGLAYYKMGECKHQWLPQVIMSSNFESTWDSYMLAYQDCKPQVFLDAAQAEVDTRLNEALENGWTP